MSDEGTYVFESKYAGALMDVGVNLIDLDREMRLVAGTQQMPQFHNYREGVNIAPVEYASAAASAMAQDDLAWPNIIRASLFMTEASQGDDRVLEDRVEHLASMAIAWLAELRNPKQPVAA